MTIDPGTAATTYFAAWKAKDFDTMRSLLADDVTFRGPMGTADDIDSAMQGLEGMGRMLKDIVVHKIFVDGTDVVTWFDLYTDDAGPMPTANWSHLENGKITAIRATFDPRPILPPDK